MYRIFVYVLFTLTFVIHHCHGNRIKVGILLMTESEEPFDLPRVGPALETGFKFAKDNLGINFESFYRNFSAADHCAKMSMGLMSELFYKYQVQSFIGPACSDSISAVGQLGEYFRVPMATGHGDLIRDQREGYMYESLTILSYNLRKLSDSITAIMNEYSWYHTAVLYDQTYVFFELAGSNLVDDFKVSYNVARPYDIPFTPTKVKDYGDLLMEAKANARVLIIFCNADLLRDILYRAYQLGMADGDFVFITMELFPSDWLGHYMVFLRGDEKDYAVTKAYESLLILTLRQPDNPEYEVFAQEVKRRALEDYGYDFGDEKVNYFITAFYDSTIYLAKAYKTVLDEGGDISDGMKVAQRLWNDTFEGITGPVKIDEVGNRVADFDLFDMVSATTRSFQMVGRFRGATQMYNPTPGVSIVWPKGKPRDVPACGFTGELCVEVPKDISTPIIVCVTVVSVAVLTFVLFFFVYRKFKEEQELGRKTWLVQPDEIKMRKARMNDSFMSKSRISIDTKEDQPSQMFTQTGYCRNNIVAIRKLNLEQVEVTRQLSVECRQMQVMSHVNLAKFVGACLVPNHMCILMEYCPRGSLQDMLQNDNIELDVAFRYSIINDIIKGMCFLHASPLRVHGRLSSTNCVIDSRFALKLTDYGPPMILSKDRDLQRRRSVASRQFNERKLLWTAPEILRKSTDISIGYSQKGDVFSFAIILQEICTRSEPYGENELDVNEILEKIITPDISLMRPKVFDTSCIPELMTMMKSCWMENPEDRPSFQELEETFRKLKQKAGHTTNIMDNLLQRMSNYADNLEQLAAERTKAYLDEKQKVEELLHRLLPEPVAKQLQTGKPVDPECYECVTIYFSDIVGFTTLASRSTPIEVVDLLNDLYTAFDSSIDKYCVYKVETIGDAYMCVSGLPERIGDRHVTEICNMSLEILNVVRVFKIRHMPRVSLKIRIGIHSGPVVAGVVGLTMPRYCLFGDTVNTASRMESTSESMKIQLSSSSKKLLENCPNYTLERRGEMEIKGKGKMTTYWLEEKEQEEDDVFLQQQLIE